MNNYDVIVIGCGPAGQKAAIKCGKVGARVAVVDNRETVGGQCLHIGTIPSKSLRAAISYLSGYYERIIYGPDYRVKKDITVDDLLWRCHSIISREIQIIHNQLRRNDVTVLQGRARFTGPNSIEVVSTNGSKEYTADKFLIATGTVPHLLQEIEFDNEHIMNTDDILQLKYLPKKLAVIGGGVIGVEYASMFSMLNIEVHLITQYTSLFPWVDRQLVDTLVEHMKNRGVTFHFGRHLDDLQVTGPKRVEGRFRETGDELAVDMVLYAAQRWGNTRELNLAAAGLAVGERDYLEVNSNYQTAQGHIYAAGDVIGWPSLASTSIDQGRKAANHMLSVADVPYYPMFPYGIYTFPVISMVGESEDRLKQDGRAYEVGVGYYRDSAQGQIIGDKEGLIKLLFDPGDHKLLGVHIIGSQASELIHLGQAVLINGGTIDYFIDTVFNYPTLAEVYKHAALNGFNKLDEALPMDHL